MKNLYKIQLLLVLNFITCIALAQQDSVFMNDSIMIIHIKAPQIPADDTIPKKRTIVKRINQLRDSAQLMEMIKQEFGTDSGATDRFIKAMIGVFQNKKDLETFKTQLFRKPPEFLLHLKNFTIEKVDSIINLDIENFYDISLDAVDTISAFENKSKLEIEIDCLTDIASQTALSRRNTPGIITVLEEEDIKTSGARDLVDILQLVPGFYFALDERGRIGLGIRGNWANEGKVLLLIDGQEMNDIFTAKLYFGNHYPVDFIKRIEIIRGPGSSIYGGYAEYGVINIITKGTEDQKGFWAGFTTGKTVNMKALKDYSISYAKQWKRNKLSASYFWGSGQRSDREAFAFYNNATNGIGQYVPLANNSDLKPSFLNLAFSHKNLSIRSIWDFYNVKDVSIIDSSQNRPVSSGFRMNFTEFKYKLDITENFNLSARLNTVFQHEETTGLPDSLLLSITRKNYTFRPKINLSMYWDISHRLNIIIGAEYYVDLYVNDFKILNTNDYENIISNHNEAYYAQIIQRFSIFNLVIGGRYENNSEYGESIVPRIAITKRFNRFNYKLLFSKAFRTPSIGNIVESFDGTYIFENGQPVGYGRNIKPENTTVSEFEVGYKLSNFAMLTANVFDINTKNPIVYNYYYQDAAINELMPKNYNQMVGINMYTNFSKAGSRGFELGILVKDNWGSIDVNYSFYTVKGKDIIPANSVSTFALLESKRELVSDNQLLAFPKHKLSANCFFKLASNVNLNFSYLIYSSRYGYDLFVDPNSPGGINGVLSKQNITMNFNAFIVLNSLFSNRLSVSCGVYNMFNQRMDYLQPYFSIKSPIPAKSREWVFKLSFDFSKHSSNNEEQEG